MTGVRSTNHLDEIHRGCTLRPATTVVTHRPIDTASADETAVALIKALLQHVTPQRLHEIVKGMDNIADPIMQA